MAFDLKAWAGQATTGGGFAGLLGIAAAVAGGQTTWQQALPLAVASAVGLAWPENKAAAPAASNLAQDLIAFVPLISAAVEHGKQSAVPQTPVAKEPVQ